jgi:PAS domain S-box-containing protein
MIRPVPGAADTAAQLLRQKAEASAGPDSAEFAPMSHEETRHALHELRVHQIELEMQNEQLRQTLDELDASRARYFDFYDLAPVGYCSIDKAGLFLHANLTAAGWMGVARGELPGQPISRFIAKDDQDIYYLMCRQVVVSGEAQTCEIRMRRHDGTQFWVSVDAVAASDESGVPALRIVLSDATARKSAEAAQRKSETRWYASIDSLNVGFLVQSPTSEILFSNPVAASLLGLSEEQLRGRTSFDPRWNVIHEDGTPFPGAAKPVPVAIATNQAVRNVIMGIHRPVTGDRVWLSASATPEFDDNGELQQVVCSFTDITVLKNAQQERRDSEKLLSESQRVAGLGGYILDLHSGLWVGTEMLDALFGIDKAYPRTVAGWVALIHPDDRTMMFDYLENDVLGKGGVFDKEYRILRHEDGAELWVHGLGTLEFDATGGASKLHGTIQDITRQKRLEHSLRKSQERINAVLDGAADAIFITDLQGRYRYANRKASELLGYDNAELLAMSIPDITPPEDLPGVMLQFSQIATDGFLLGEFELMRKDGGRVPVELNAIVLAEGEIFGSCRDITERKLAEKALIQSRNLLRAVIDNAPMRVFWKDQNLRFLGCNPLFARDAGKTVPEELIGKDDFEMGWADQAELYRDDDRAVMASAVARLSYEEQQTTPDGKTIWLRTSKTPLLDSDGQTTGILGVYEDITERKAVEISMKESGIFKRAILDSVSSNIAVLDRDGVIVEVNELWRLFALKNGGTPGLPAANIDVGVNYLDICGASHGDSEEGAHAAHDGIRNVLDGRLPQFSLEYPCHSPTSQRWFEMSVTPLATAKGGAVVVHSDITERRRVATDLLLSETKYRLLMEQAAEAVVVADMTGNILEVNSRAATLLGYEEDELPGRNISMIHPAEELQHVAEAFAAFERFDRVEILETLVLTKQGRRVPVSITSKAIILADRTVSMGIFRDLSEQHQRDAQRLRQEEAHRDALVREVHHRIKNSLQGVTGILRELAQRKPEMTSDLDTVISQVGSIALVHGLSGAESGGRVTLCALVADVTRNARMIWHKDIVADFKHDCRHCVVNEREAVPLALVLNELLANACKHSAAGDVRSKLEVAVECNINDDADGEPVRARVRIVNPGHLVPGFDFGRKCGLGTGLSLVAALLPKHGATLVLTQQAIGVETLLELSAPVFTERLIEEGNAA